MLAYILKRLLVSIPTLIVVTLVVFVAMKLVPGDPARMLAGELAQPNEIQAIRKELGLDKPLITQYLAYLRGLLRGDLGVSYRSKRPVARELVLRYPNTIRLALSSLFLAVLFGVITGVVSAARQGSIIDKASRIVALLGVTTPTFWLGLMLLLLFAVHWDVFPAAYVPGWRGICLPALTLGLNATAFISRMTRSCVLEVIRQDYVRTARAKGLVERVVIYRHVLRSAMVGIVTVVGIQAGSLLAGAIVVESVFSWPGLGLLMVDSLAYRDFPTVQGAVLLVAVMVLTVNLTVDVLYSVIDPRIVY